MMSTSLSDAELLARLVSFDTSGSNGTRPLADAISDYLDEPGTAIHRVESDDHRKINLVVCVKGDGADHGQRKGLVLSGHMDVVPAGEPDWRSDPFTLTETEDAYIGRGVCDMKGFVALAVNVARWASNRPLRFPLVLILTYDEEVGSFGAMELVKSWNHDWPLPGSAVIGEPSSLRLVRMHKGHLKIRITCFGQAAHSGYPHLGINAIEPAADIVSALSELRIQWMADRHDTSCFFPETPYAALNVAQIQGGSAINIVPERCVIDVGIRALPGMDSEAMFDQVRRTVESVGEGIDRNVEVLHNNPPMLLSEESVTYRRFADVFHQEETLGVSYASDAGILQQLGMECVIWGPGSIEVAHKPNEFLPKKEFAEARPLLEKLVTTFCT